MLKDSLLVSDKVSELSDFDFRLWIVLILLADDYGVADARPEIIKGHGFPLRNRVTVKDISESLRRLAAGRCVSLYKVGGKPYVQFPRWGDHQRLRDSKHKYPLPEDADGVRGELPQVAASCGELRPELETELELETEIETEVKSARARTRFTPPTVEEVSAYAKEKGWTEDRFSPERFVDFYASKGWIVGKNPMKDWKAAARGWVSRQEQPVGYTSRNAPAPGSVHHDNERNYSAEDYSKCFIDIEKEFGGQT